LKNLIYPKFNNILLALLLGLAGTGSLWAADEWPMFKGDAAHSGVNPSDALLPPLTLKWTGGNTIGAANRVAYSSPVVFGGAEAAP